jgi:hypothetical protein
MAHVVDANRQQATSRVRGQGIDRIEDRLRNPASLVYQDQWVQRMNPLQRRLIVISRLAAKATSSFSARAHVLLVIERDAARKVALR